MSAISEVSKNKKNGIPHASGGQLVREFVEVDAALKAAKKRREELEPQVIDLGLDFIARHNCAGQTAIKSVKLEADTGEGGVIPTVLVSWTEKAKRVDSAEVKAAFANFVRVDGQKARLSDYARWELGAEFDTSVFFANGRFDGHRYAAIMRALDKVAAELGCANPLSLTKTLVPKPDFMLRRFVDFTPEQNLRLQQILPTTVSVKAVAGAGISD